MVIFGEKLKLRELISLATLLFLIMAIPITVQLVKQQQIYKSRATGEFNIGVNMTGITHSGSGDIDANLAEVARMGGKIVRVFAARDHISHDKASRRLDYFLTRAQAYGISAIVVFIDFYGSGYRPQGTEGFYTDIWNGIPLLNHDFFAGGYQGSYKQFVETVVSQNKQHSNIYAWEMGNELKDDGDPATFVNFMRDVSSTIKNIDPTHQIASGMLSAGHTNLSPDALYGAVPDIDIVTIHMYNGDRAGTTDAEWAVSRGKVVINEEVGFSGSHDRTQQMRDEIDFWKSRGVAAILQWGFIARDLGDNGFGDRDVGMDTLWHTDYDSLFALYQSYNGGSNPNVSPGPIVSPGSSCNIGYQADISDTCISCIKDKDPNLVSGIRNLNTSKFNNCSDKELINYWCNGGIGAQATNDCNSLKNSCSASCGNTVATPSPVSSPTSAGSVGGRVWEDLDGNKTINGSETPLGGIRVYLDSALKSQTTNAQGYYTFDGVAEGSHMVLLDLGDLDSGNWTKTTPVTVSVNVTAGMQSNVAFGLRHPVSSSMPTLKPSSFPTSTPKPSPSKIPTPTPSPFPTIPLLSSDQVKYDLNSDNKVNSVDIGIFLTNWRNRNNLTSSEFNGDGVVNTVDYALLIKNFSQL